MENGNTIGEKSINLWEQRNSAIQKLNPDLDNFVIYFIAYNSNVCSGLRTHGILFLQQRFSTFIHNARPEDVISLIKIPRILKI